MSRFLDDTHKELEPMFGPKWWRKTKNGFLDEERLGFVHNNAEKAVDKLIKLVRERFKKEIDLKKEDQVMIGGFGKVRKATTELGEGEELLERLITLSMDDVRNQLNLMSGLTDNKSGRVKKMNIDLVLLNNMGGIREMVELKIGRNPETPISAMVQLLSYYLFFREAEKFCKKAKLTYPSTAKRVKLTVLAPEEYYSKHLGKSDASTALLDKIAKTAYRHLNRQYKTEEKVYQLAFKRIAKFRESKLREYKKIVTEIRESCAVWEKL